MRYAALLLLALALPLSACGTSLNAVAKAANKASAKGSEHVAFTASVAVGAQTMQMTGVGDFQSSPKLGAAHLSMSAGGRDVVIDEVMQGSRVYMKSPLFSSQLPAGKSWMAIDLQKAGKRLGINFNQFAQQDPTDALTALKKAGSVTKVGAETIDGVETTHYRATLDLTKAASSKALQLANVKTLPADVWIDGQNQLRRVTMHYVQPVSGRTAATNLQMDLSNYGEQVSVQVPSASETVDMTNLGG